jgi:hypothetical protein
VNSFLNNIIVNDNDDYTEKSLEEDLKRVLLDDTDYIELVKDEVAAQLAYASEREAATSKAVKEKVVSEANRLDHNSDEYRSLNAKLQRLVYYETKRLEYYENNFPENTVWSDLQYNNFKKKFEAKIITDPNYIKLVKNEDNVKVIKVAVKVDKTVVGDDADSNESEQPAQKYKFTNGYEVYYEDDTTFVYCTEVRINKETGKMSLNPTRISEEVGKYIELADSDPQSQVKAGGKANRNKKSRRHIKRCGSRKNKRKKSFRQRRQ